MKNKNWLNSKKNHVGKKKKEEIKNNNEKIKNIINDSLKFIDKIIRID